MAYTEGNGPENIHNLGKVIGNFGRRVEDLKFQNSKKLDWTEFLEGWGGEGKPNKKNICGSYGYRTELHT